MGPTCPNVPAYLTCYRQFLHDVESKYHVPASDFVDFAYNLDISTFTQQTQQAIVQFKAAGVTTVLESCDPYSAGLLTQAAAQQNYHPEWFETGTSLDDQDPCPADL